jgi:hypothetical protein
MNPNYVRVEDGTTDKAPFTSITNAPFMARTYHRGGKYLEIALVEQANDVEVRLESRL